MSNSKTEQIIQAYLSELAQALSQHDKALIQDALFDSENHLHEALNDLENPDKSINLIIKNYGSAENIAQYYLELESTENFAMCGKNLPSQEANTQHFYSILKNVQAYRGLVFSLLSFPLGILYFAWTIFAGITSVVTSVFVVGTPLLVLYLKSMQYFSLFEGRLIEVLLGERMPRRLSNVTTQSKQSFKQMIIAVVQQRRIWTSVIYMALKLPIGVMVFITNVVPSFFAIAFMFTPIIDPIMHAINPSVNLDLTIYWLPLTVPVGIIGFIGTLHLTKWLTGLHVRFAKYMLVHLPN